MLEAYCKGHYVKAGNFASDIIQRGPVLPAVFMMQFVYTE